jgi:hypothetical protein
MALLTLLLKLLNKTRCNLLLMNRKALTVTSGALLYILWIISACSPAMWADNFAVIGYFVFFANVKFL